MGVGVVVEGFPLERREGAVMDEVVQSRSWRREQNHELGIKMTLVYFRVPISR